MTVLKLFLVCTFKDPKLAEKWTILAGEKKLNSVESMEFVFSKSAKKQKRFGQ